MHLSGEWDQYVHIGGTGTIWDGHGGDSLNLIAISRGLYNFPISCGPKSDFAFLRFFHAFF